MNRPMNMRDPLKIITQSFAILTACSAFVAGAGLVPVDLRSEYMKNPLGIDVVKPRLSWKIEAGGQKAEDRGREDRSPRSEV